MKLSLSAFFLVFPARCSKNTAAATADANDTGTAAVLTKEEVSKVKAKDPNVTVTTVAGVADIEAAITASTFVPPICVGNEKLIEVAVLTDYWPEETTWEVKRQLVYQGFSYKAIDPIMSGGPYPSERTLYEDALCVQEGEYQFTIYVSDLYYMHDVHIYCCVFTFSCFILLYITTICCNTVMMMMSRFVVLLLNFHTYFVTNFIILALP